MSTQARQNCPPIQKALELVHLQGIAQNFRKITKRARKQGMTMLSRTTVSTQARQNCPPIQKALELVHLQGIAQNFRKITKRARNQGMARLSRIGM